jgi:hypothetical protein
MPRDFCGWVILAALNFAAALVLAAIFRAQDLPAALAIMLIAAALSVAQALFWAWICGYFRRDRAHGVGDGSVTRRRNFL